MIFVTVGTHEQQFDRLLREIDDLRESGVIKEELVIQMGYSTHVINCDVCEKILPYNEVVDYVKDARIVITHGGPASFMMPLQYGKIPVVVPRKLKFNEHVNDHQVDFVEELSNRYNSIIPVYDISELEEIIKDYDVIVDKLTNGINSNTKTFCCELEKIVDELFKK